MRYFIDFEFVEDGRVIDPVSIGVACEDGRRYYAVFTDCPWVKFFDNPWLVENVFPHLPFNVVDPTKPLTWGNADPDYRTKLWKPSYLIRADLLKFTEQDKYGKPEFWGYYADYDWVALCQLYGRMIDLPRDWPMYCRDIKQLADMLGNPELPKSAVEEHHALADAEEALERWKFLVSYGESRGIPPQFMVM